MVKAVSYPALKCIIKDKLEEMLHRGWVYVLIKGRIMCIMGNGWMIYLMEKGNKIGKMERNIKENLLMGRKMVRGCWSLGLMDRNILGILSKISSKVKVNSFFLKAHM